MNVLDFTAALSALHMIEDHQIGLLVIDVWLRKVPTNSEISITLDLYELEEKPAICIDIELPSNDLKAVLGGDK
jgi:hypothetical protein